MSAPVCMCKGNIGKLVFDVFVCTVCVSPCVGLRETVQGQLVKQQVSLYKPVGR